STLENAAAVIGSGRYGGRGSWGHSGALGGTVLTGVLRSTIGAVALPLLLGASLLTALAVSAVVGMSTDDTDHFLRWGIAVVALIIMLTCWVIASTAPEVDLEDGEGEISKPLFSRAAEEPADELEAMDWEADGEGEQATGSAKPGKGSAARRERARRRAEGGGAAPPASGGPGRPRSAPVGPGRPRRPQPAAPASVVRAEPAQHEGLERGAGVPLRGGAHQQAVDDPHGRVHVQVRGEVAAGDAVGDDAAQHVLDQHHVLAHAGRRLGGEGRAARGLRDVEGDVEVELGVHVRDRGVARGRGVADPGPQLGDVVRGLVDRVLDQQA